MTEPDGLESSDAVSKKSHGGEFFAIDSGIWAKLTAAGMNEAVAYLVLACGTGRDNRTTSWSSQALHNYAGISWENGRAAIERLAKRGLIRYAESHTRFKPR